MIGKRTGRGVVVAVAMLAVLLLILVAGCGKKAAETTSAPTGPTALGSLDKARSALSTMAPDAELLVVQTAQAATPTGTPVWAYLFGSPSTDKTYVVYISNGESMGAQEYGQAGLSKDEWKTVSGSNTWKVDSDEAYDKALAASGAKGDPAAYFMGMLTYKAAEDTSTIKPLVWQVMFEPGESGATTNTIEVDGMTGKAKVSTTK